MRTNLLIALLLTLLASMTSSQIWTLTNLLMSGTQATYHGLGYEESVTHGVELALDECKKQFKWNPWNCPQDDFFHIFSKSQPLRSTRETAFVHAIISAGIVHTIAQNCSRGDFKECGCHDRRLKERRSEESKVPGFRWGGCSDDVNFGMKVAKSFLDEQEPERDPISIMNMHNNNVGRMAVKNTMVKKCKCHGVSGSCTTQTCWMKVAPFHDIGNYIKESYRKALKIGRPVKENKMGRVKKNIADQLSVSAISASVPKVNDNIDPPTMKLEEDMRNLPLSRLAFTEESPNYCFSNRSNTSFETLGRTCSRRKGQDVPLEERKSCRNLCRACGLKVKRHKKKVVNKHCNCKLEFCCEVKCETCTSEEMTFTCSL